MQMYMWDIRFSSGLSRDYAMHQLELHLLVLSHLKDTYWSADMQHSLFSRMLAIVNEGQTGHSLPRDERDRPSERTNELHSSESWVPESLEEFLHSFNPFVGMPMPESELRCVSIKSH